MDKQTKELTTPQPEMDGDVSGNLAMGLFINVIVVLLLVIYALTAAAI